MEKNLVPVSGSKFNSYHLFPHTYISHTIASTISHRSHSSGHTYHGNFTCEKLVTTSSNRRCDSSHFKSIRSSKGYSRTLPCTTTHPCHHIFPYVVFQHGYADRRTYRRIGTISVATVKDNHHSDPCSHRETGGIESETKWGTIKRWSSCSSADE